MELRKNLEQVTIKKASGDTEPFDVSKLKSSLKKAGAGDAVITEIVADIENWVYDGVSTRKIYSRAYKLFRLQNSSGALLYKLKMAINDMGPSGFPFEQFIGELFKGHGYEVKVGQILEGVSITHEMDVIATKGKEHNLIECKFSPNQGKHISIQVPLYVHSRVNDISEKLQQDPRYKDISFVAWVVTNARFSSDSIAYSRSKGIHLLGWDYPADNALKNMIEREKIFPITILTNLSKLEKQKLMANDIVTCKQLMNLPGRLEQLGLSKVKQRSVFRELEALGGMTE